MPLGFATGRTKTPDVLRGYQYHRLLPLLTGKTPCVFSPRTASAFGVPRFSSLKHQDGARFRSGTFLTLLAIPCLFLASL